MVEVSQGRAVSIEGLVVVLDEGFAHLLELRLHLRFPPVQLLVSVCRLTRPMYTPSVLNTTVLSAPREHVRKTERALYRAHAAGIPSWALSHAGNASGPREIQNLRARSSLLSCCLQRADKTRKHCEPHQYHRSKKSARSRCSASGGSSFLLVITSSSPSLLAQSSAAAEMGYGQHPWFRSIESQKWRAGLCAAED